MFNRGFIFAINMLDESSFYPTNFNKIKSKISALFPRIKQNPSRISHTHTPIVPVPHIPPRLC